MEKKHPYVLCTRPVLPAQQAKACEAGVILEGISFIETKALNNDALQNKVMKLAGKEANVVFTSMNAVESVAALIFGEEYLFQNRNTAAEKTYGTTDNHTFSSPIREMAAGKKNTPRWNIYSIGGKTAQLAEELFPSSVIKCEAPYGKMLAKKIILDNPKGSLVFFCGNIRREELPDQLRKGGFTLEEITVYETALTPKPLERRYDGVLFFSPSAVESYFSLHPPHPAQYFFAIGETTASAIRTFTSENLLFSPSTDKDALINTAIDFFTQQKTTKNTP